MEFKKVLIPCSHKKKKCENKKKKVCTENKSRDFSDKLENDFKNSKCGFQKFVEIGYKPYFCKVEDI
eukprot:TRINITY_DN1683_c1_g1_i1.p3 TRINITY_DN1683_c1_g1~~TRINITY_DN1683_c1_g1_i1.p3  ORF type:complete len:67 (+),score=14.34 TRINITY_DN1683_c1_g1_i1:427-627(+)